MPALLFSYGSNDPTRLAERLGHPVDSRPAFIDGYERAFRGYSSRWDGGVATLLPRTGARTYGHVVPVTPADLRVLDEREGVPVAYTRAKLPVTVGAEHGADQVVPSWVYLARSNEHHTPSRRYLEACARTIGAHWRSTNGEPVTWRDIPIR